MRCFRCLVQAALAVALCGAWPAMAQVGKLALLVGVGEFADKSIPKLEGPQHDVDALSDVLLSRWGYAPQSVVKLTNARATKGNIVAEIKALQARSKSGDEIFIYFSGHGTSALDARLGLPIPYGSGAFAPYDARLSGTQPLDTLLVGRTDLRPLLEELDRGGRKVWVVSDSCYSAQQVRSLAPAQGKSLLAGRSIPLLDGVQRNDYLLMRERASAYLVRTEAYPYRNIAFLAASAEGEIAQDITRQALPQYPTVDGLPHGALTDALLRVFHGKIPADFDGDGTVNLHEMHQAVGQFMAQRAYGHTPQRLPSVAEDTVGLASRSLLAGSGVAKVNHAQELPQLLVDASALPAPLQATLPAIPFAQWSAVGAHFKLSQQGQRVRLLTSAGDRVSDFALNDRSALTGQLQQLAWAHRFDALARKLMRGVLAAEITPALMGGNFLLGDKLRFVLQSERQATALLLNVDSSGKVSVLYPDRAAELAPLAAGQIHAIPGAGAADVIAVKEPLGMDVQFIFAFDQPAPDLRAWLGKGAMNAGDPQLAELERLLLSASGKFSYVRTELRVLEKP